MLFLRSAELPIAFLNKISCFETLRSIHGRLLLFEEHFFRLGDSCKSLGRICPVSREELKKWLNQSLRESGYKNALIRLSIHWPRTEGRGQRAEGGRMVAIIRKFEGYPERLYKKGVSLKTVVQRRWTLKAQDPQIKASQFMSGVMAQLDSSESKAHELLFLGSMGTVAEGSVSNIFIIDGKRVLTPSVASGILRGATRGFVISLARKRRLEVLETFLTRHELYSARECFLTNTSSGILPVVSIDNRKIGDGRPGPMTRMLNNDFRNLI